MMGVSGQWVDKQRQVVGPNRFGSDIPKRSRSAFAINTYKPSLIDCQFTCNSLSLSLFLALSLLPSGSLSFLEQSND